MAAQSTPGSNGFALIVSNDYSTTPPEVNLQRLGGTKEDAIAMDRTFKALNFTTVRWENLNRLQLTTAIYETTQRTRYPATCKSIAFVFSGHGTLQNLLYMQDGSTLSIGHIVEQFLPAKAPQIGSIPKLFFIDACRGDAEMQAVTVPRGGGSKASVEVLQKGGTEVPMLRVPPEGNFLLAYSTMPTYKAYELQGRGGVWMTALAHQLRESRASVEDILSSVNQELMETVYQDPMWRNRIQQPEKISRLNSVVCLHPGVVPNGSATAPKPTASHPGLGRSISQEGGKYRALLNDMFQAKQITKPDFSQTIEHKDGIRNTTVGFTGVVLFTINDLSKRFEGTKEITKALALEKAAELACKWIDQYYRRSSVSARGVRPPIPTQSPPEPVIHTSPPSTRVGGSIGKTSSSRLKEYCDKQRCGDPVYTEIPVHGEQQFLFTVTVNLRPSRVTATGGVCSSKKDAKQSAALKALQKLTNSI